MKISEELFKQSLRTINAYKLQNNNIVKDITEESFVRETNLSLRGRVALVYFCLEKTELNKYDTPHGDGETSVRSMQLKELKGYSKSDFLNCHKIGISRFLEIEQILLEAGILIKDDITNKNLKKNKLKFEDFKISVRLLNCLYSMDLIYLDQLTTIRMSDIKKYRMFGEKSQNELVEFMKSHNIYFLGEKPSKKLQEHKTYSKVDRVEVIEHSKGRVYTNYNAKDVDIQLQDDGKTLKIFFK